MLELLRSPALRSRRAMRLNGHPILRMQMVNPEGWGGKPLLNRVAQQFFRDLIDIAEAGEIHAASPQDHLRRLHKLPVTLLAPLQFQRLRGKSPVDKGCQYCQSQDHQRNAGDADDSDSRDFDRMRIVR